MQEPIPSRFTEEQMATVRQTDLPDLLSSLGYQVKPKGGYHTLADMPHIMIKRRTSYYDNYNQTWGDGITFLREFHNMDFEEAVNHLLAWGGHFEGKTDDIKLAAPDPPKQKPKAPFQLPESNENNRRAYAYLLKRGISRHVISSFINNGSPLIVSEHPNIIEKETPHHEEIQ